MSLLSRTTSALCSSSIRRIALSTPASSKEAEEEFFRPAKNEEPKKDIQVADGKSKMLDKVKPGLFDTRTVPTSLAIPNPKGVDGYNPEVPMEEIVKSIPKIAKDQSKMLWKEIKEIRPSVEKVEMLEDMGLLRHNEAHVEYTFDKPECFTKWKTGCDGDWKEGYSSCSFGPTDSGTAMFRGNICTEVVKDGRVERAGWASIKLEDRKALNRKRYLEKWANFTHMLVKCRGDGRSYKVMLHAPLALDVTWGDSYSYHLHTHGGPYWQYEKIPFSKFIHTVNGRIQDKQQRVNLRDVSSVGIVLMDRIDGEFALEIDYIGVYNDRTHLENFAYETYTLPVFNTHGF